MLLKSLIIVLLSFVPCIVAAAESSSPKRLMILVFDQTRADYIDRFDLKNFKRARKMGVHFENGIVGHLESNTVISHPVISTGRMPKNLPWSMHVMKDTRGIYGAKDLYYSAFALGDSGWHKGLKETAGTSSIMARIKGKRGGKTFAVAQKKYAAMNYGGPYADTIIALGEVQWDGAYKGHYKPEGINVPSYISNAPEGRFYIDATNDWGSGEMVYPFHGNVFIEGRNPKRRGGDAWVGDVVEKIMANETNWTAILASFGSIDKVAHVLHEHDGPTNYEWAKKNGISLADTAKKADWELGRILDRLEQTGLINETVVLITADHGGQYSRHFHGTLAANKHQQNLVYGKSQSFDNEVNYPAALKPVYDTGVVEVASHNTMLSFWLKGGVADKDLQNFLTRLEVVPGVSQIYEKRSNGRMHWYHETYRSRDLKGQPLVWAKARNPDLLFSIAGDNGPDIVALLFDGHGYDVPGSHGGGQEKVQRIPFTVIAPNIKQKGVVSATYVRLVDVNPIAAKLLGLPAHPGVDGKDEGIKPFVK